MGNVRELTTGRWPGILAALGIEATFLTGKHGPCPICGGKDRYHFDDLDGRGTYFCNSCGAGDGFSLLTKVKGWDFRTAAREVEQVAGVIQVSRIPSFSDDDKVKALTRVWRESHPLQDGDEVMNYLAGRGLHVDLPMSALRLHPNLAYRDGAEVIGRFPALVAMVSGTDGKGVTLHRTYLKDGKKAPVASPRKLMPGKPVNGAAIRLFPAGTVLGVAEGIETAIAANRLFGVPVWSCVSANGIESFKPPTDVRQVIVFADNDASGTGQSASWALAKRLISAGIQAEVKTPSRVGTDWADELEKVSNHV